MFDLFSHDHAIHTVWYLRPEILPALSGILGVVIGGFINWISLRWNYNREQKNIKTRSAMFLSSILDNYAAECSSFLANTTRELQDSEQVDNRSFDLPDAPRFPEEIDISSLEHGSALQALLLTGQTQLEQFAIRAIEQERDNDWGKNIKKRIAVHGCKYLEMAEQIREKNGIPNPNPDQLGWDYKTHLKRAAKKKD